jgi:hypothetical protein
MRSYFKPFPEILENFRLGLCTEIERLIESYRLGNTVEVRLFGLPQGQGNFLCVERRVCCVSNELSEVRVIRLFSMNTMEFNLDGRRARWDDCDDKAAWDSLLQTLHTTFSCPSGFRLCPPSFSSCTSLSFVFIVSSGRGYTPRQHLGKICPNSGS